jgi:amidase
MIDYSACALARGCSSQNAGQLLGPLHGVTFAIKDQYDTFDMRTTSGADVDYADDRPPADATFVTRLRAAGAIILAKSTMGEYASGVPRSSFSGVCNSPYDTERSPMGSSSGSASAVAANLVTCGIGEETGTSIRGPACYNSCVGIAATQELVSRHGMIDAGASRGHLCDIRKTDTRWICRRFGWDSTAGSTADEGVLRVQASTHGVGPSAARSQTLPRYSR